jgi:putative membrane protein
VSSGGAKPAEFYLESTTFWLKMAAFVAVALLSIMPTIRYAGWRRALD